MHRFDSGRRLASRRLAARSAVADLPACPFKRKPGGGLVIDREKLRSALLDVKGYSGLSGTLDCGTTGDCAQGGRIAIYEAPDLPVSRPGAEPVFSQSKSIAELLTGP